MEKVHKSANRPWISDRINVKKYRDDWWSSLSSHKFKNTKDVFHLNDKEYSQIEAECGLEAMKCPLQYNVEVCKKMIIPVDVKLETLRLQKEDLDRRETDAHYASLSHDTRKFYNYPPPKVSDSEVPDDVSFEIVQEPDVLLCIQIFRPEKKFAMFQRPSSQRNPYFTVDQEFYVLGSQFLTEIRDKIICVSDEAIPGDYSSHPNHPPEVTCKDLYKSGFFYIDGVFYNDMRHQDCRDYSDIIIKWAASQDRGVGPFRKAAMEKTKFIDLDIQLGYPYVYVHQGNCEHLIVFSDLLMHSPHHNCNRNEYPLHVVLKQKKRSLCMICQKHTVEWIVYDNKRLPENPFYFCKVCFFSFNYDENDQKIGYFRAYHHIDRSTII